MNDPSDLVYFVFGDHNEENVGSLVRIGSGAVPVGHASSHFIHNSLRNSELLCKDHDTHIDVLDVDPVTCYRRNNSVDQRVDHCFQIEHQKTDSIYEDIDDGCHFTNTEITELLCKVKTKYVLSAAGTAASKYQSGSKSGNNTSNDTGCQTVIDERTFRNRDESKGCGLHNDGDDSTKKRIRVPSYSMPDIKEAGLR